MRVIRKTEETEDISAVVLDNSRLQEMLRRQMESTRKRITNPVENQRLQELLKKQLIRSKYQDQILVGENMRFNRNLYSKVLSMQPPKITSQEVDKLHSTIQQKLNELNLELPELNQWDQPDSQQKIFRCIIDLCNIIQTKKRDTRIELENREQQLVAERNKQKDTIKNLEYNVNQKKQYLQMLMTQVNDEELKSKEAKRQHLLKLRPKEQLLQRLQKRHRLTTKELH